MKVGDNLYVLYLIICSLTLNAFIELRLSISYHSVRRLSSQCRKESHESSWNHIGLSLLNGNCGYGKIEK